MSKALRLAVDVGGTFTDLVAEWDDKRATTKVLTTPAAPELGVMAGVERLLGQLGKRVADIVDFVHGTTLATNAIIERRGAVTALIGTAGFRDILEIGTESRYDQYELALDRPKPLVPRPLRFTVRERTDTAGHIRMDLNRSDVEALVPAMRAKGVQSVAVAFMHAYANPVHEQTVRAMLLRAMPDLYVSISCEVCPEIREYERNSTTVANAYVQPLMAGYLQRMVTAFRDRGFVGRLSLMASGGGLTSVDTAVAFPVRLVESGPAGGAIFAAREAERLGDPKVLAFDMGGTTAKVSLIDDFEWESARNFEVDRAARFLKGSGLPLRIPCIDMVEIGAGGGSLARVDILNKVLVGPESAGSEPGPACYGRGGTHPAVTDANVALGLIDPSSFAGGSIGLSVEKAHQALEAHVGLPLGIEPNAAAHAVYESVCENMANAARVHCVERGAIAGGRTVIAFGGAAPLHVARVAEKIGARRVVIPRNAGVGSAVGFLAAPVSYELVKTRYTRLDRFDFSEINHLFGEMSSEVRGFVTAAAAGAPVDEIRRAYMRYAGQGHEIAIELQLAPLGELDAVTLRNRFETAYEALFHRSVPGAPIEIMAWSVWMGTRRPRVDRLPSVERLTAPPGQASQVFDGASGAYVAVRRYDRDALMPGMTVAGPAIIAERETSIFVTASFDAWVDAAGSIVMEPKEPKHG